MKNLENEDIFESIKNPPEVGVVRIFGEPEFWDTTIGLTHAVTTQGIATIHLPSGPLKHGRSTMAPSETHLDKQRLQPNRIELTN